MPNKSDRSDLDKYGLTPSDWSRQMSAADEQIGAKK